MILEKQVGPHRLTRDGEDILVLHFASSPTETEAAAIVDAEVEMMADTPYYLCIDFTRAETMSAPVRRAFGVGAMRVKIQAVGIYGASFHVKVLSNLVANAISLFRKATFPSGFFDSREEVLKWFDELRRRRAAGLSSGTAA